MKKSIFSFILAMVCVLSFMACSGGGKQTPVDNCKVDTDGDGTQNCDDQCPTDPEKTDPGDCGCGIVDIDSDNDGVSNCLDNCDNSQDADSDGTPDCNDRCPLDVNKTEPGVYGCGLSDTDTDNDGTPDFNDRCPTDPNKTNPGSCGCNISDVDTDGDSIPDCLDDCDNLKDTDGDGTSDCEEDCPTDPNKVEPGSCGCGVSDVDTDGDSIPDCGDTVLNDGQTMETAKLVTLVNNEAAIDDMIVGIEKSKWYSLNLEKDQYFDSRSLVLEGAEHDMEIISSTGERLAFNPDGQKWNNIGARIYNFLVPATGKYYVRIKSYDELSTYRITFQEYSTWKTTSLCPTPYDEEIDCYECDGEIYDAKSISKGMVQYRTAMSWSPIQYDKDCIFFYGEFGKDYIFTILNIIDTNLSAKIYDRYGNQLYSSIGGPFDPEVKIEFSWSSPVDDWYVVVVSSSKSNIIGKYSIVYNED